MIVDPQNLPNDLSILAIKILCHLAENEGSNVTAIAKAISPQASKASLVSASGHLFNLEQQGLVMRSRPTDDRRQSLFTLTRAGKALVQSWQPALLATL